MKNRKFWFVEFKFKQDSEIKYSLPCESEDEAKEQVDSMIRNKLYMVNLIEVDMVGFTRCR